MVAYMKTYVFNEPHITGGTCLVTITYEQIIDYMYNLPFTEARARLLDRSRDEIVDYFIVNYGAWEINR